MTGTSGRPQTSGHGWAITEGQERLGLPCGNSNCQGRSHWDLQHPHFHISQPCSHLPALGSLVLSPPALSCTGQSGMKPPGASTVWQHPWAGGGSGSPCSVSLCLCLSMLTYPCSEAQFPSPEGGGRASSFPGRCCRAQVGKCRQGNPEWRFRLWGDEETPLSELSYSPSRAGFGVSHPPAGPCSSPAVASPLCVGSGEGAVPAFPPLFQDFSFYFRLNIFLSSWR